jgi:phage replication O-like protein O
MASPQLEEGYTKIANEIMDALCRMRIPGEERQVLDAILRKTYGWNKCEDKISMGQIAEMTGLKRQNVNRAIKSLSSKMITSVIKSDYKGINILKLNKNYEEWRVIKNDYRKARCNQKRLQGVIKNDDKGVIKNDSHKRKKENIQKKGKSPKTRLPDNFTISDHVKAWAVGKGFNHLDEHCESFKRKCRAKGYEYVDWDAAFMEAIRENWGKISNNGGRPPPGKLKKLSELPDLDKTWEEQSKGP